MSVWLLQTLVYDTELITAVKSFMVQGPGLNYKMWRLTFSPKDKKEKRKMIQLLKIKK
jgi:hypothetical protein